MQNYVNTRVDFPGGDSSFLPVSKDSQAPKGLKTTKYRQGCEIYLKSMSELVVLILGNNQTSASGRIYVLKNTIRHHFLQVIFHPCPHSQGGKK